MRMQALVDTLLRRARLETDRISLAPVAADELFTQLSEARSIQLAAKDHAYSTAFLAGCRRRRGVWRRRWAMY